LIILKLNFFFFLWIVSYNFFIVCVYVWFKEFWAVYRWLFNAGITNQNSWKPQIKFLLFDWFVKQKSYIWILRPASAGVEFIIDEEFLYNMQLRTITNIKFYGCDFYSSCGHKTWWPTGNGGCSGYTSYTCGVHKYSLPMYTNRS